ncbi:glycerol-3-phosphate 1-O-acyltransferase PlsY [[Mycoplasma] gypis]|uniref:Glycerol-3-phosphate acyltransferase n=1 Tax=[Mycoplasma] gypis TaxID=92404 RepID=A0ABZ2RQX1_9BACT|nr:glycerol-3-phosphate 1-O-acyltransferase PlsY [[Mycoplasma] gypis]MBN0919644.1 glycerol-3-phosphate 1-O-acyltransferase PlsY [[Mycoplasma] gypis]
MTITVEDLWINIFVLLAGYIIGSVSGSLILAKITGKEDIRNKGSKNAGSTNALRVYGKKFGMLTFAFDVLKSLVPVYIAFGFKYLGGVAESIIPLLAGLGALIGHIFPIFFKFKGGKGAACFLGMVISLNVILLLVGIIIFVSIVWYTKYVSLGSLIAPFILACLSFIYWIAAGPLGFIGWGLNDYWWLANGVIMLIGDLFVIVMHRSNIHRLIEHKENKLKLK